MIRFVFEVKQLSEFQTQWLSSDQKSETIFNTDIADVKLEQ
jgi:hypothetical protein